MLQISQRLRGIKEDGEAIEEEGFMPKLKEAFGKAGVAIEDENGELRSTYAILNDLAGVWDSLSSKQQQFLGEKAAGNRQVKVLNAIMQNWDVVQDTIQKANEATGEATKGNEKYLDSIEGRITQFKSAFQDLARTTINSDLVKGIVGFGTSVVDITTNLGGLVPIVTTLLGLITAIKATNIQKSWDSFSKSLKMSFSSQGIGGGIGKIGLFVAGLTALGTAISVLEKRLDKFNILNQSKSDYKVATENLESTKTKLQGVKEQIANIKSLGSLSFVQKQELADLEKMSAELETQYEIQKNIVEVQKEAAQANFAQLLESYSAYSTGYAGFDFLNNLKQLAASGISGDSLFGFIGDGLSQFGVKVEDWGKSNKEIFDTAVDDFKKAHTEITQNNIETFNELQANEMQLMSGATPTITANIEENRKLRNEAYDNLNQALIIYQKYQAASEGIERNNVTEPYFAMLDQMAESLNTAMQYANDLSAALKTPFDNILNSQQFENVSNDLIKLAKEGKLTKETFSDVKGIQQFIDTIDSLGISVYDAINYLNADYSPEAIANTEGIQNYTQSLSSLIENNYLASKSYETLSKAMSEQDKSGKISMQTYQQLIALDKNLANAMTLTADGYTLNNKAVTEYIKSKNEEQKLQALLRYDEQAQKLEELKNKFDELNSASIKTDDITKQIAENMDMQDATQQEMEALAAYIRELDAATGALERFKSAKSSANEDANYKESQNVYKTIQEGNKTGKRNIDDYQSAVDYVLGDNWREHLEDFGGSVEKAYAHAENVAKRYSGQKDEKTAINNFMKDVADNGFGTYDKKSGSLQLNETANLDEMASKLKVSKDYLVDMFRLLNTYAGEGEGFVFPEMFSDDDKKKAEERKQAIKENEKAQQDAADKIEEINKQIQDANEKGNEVEQQRLEQRKARLEETQATLQSEHTDLESGVELNVDTMTLEEAKQKIDDLYQVIQTLNGEGINVPVTISDEYNTLFETLPELRGELEQPLVPIAVEVEDNATEELTGVKEATEEIPESTDTTVNAQVEGAEELNAQLNDVAKERTAIVKVKYEKLGDGDTVNPSDLSTDFIEQYQEEHAALENGDTNIIPMVTKDQVVSVKVEAAEGSGENIVSQVQSEIDGNEINFNPDLNIDEWGLFSDEQSKETEMLVHFVGENPEEPIQQVQDAANANPVKIPTESSSDTTFNKDDVSKISSHVGNLTGAARQTGGAAKEITELTNAYIALANARKQAESVDVGDSGSAESAANAISEAAKSFQTAYSNLQSKLGETGATVEVDADTSAALNKVQAIADNGVTVDVKANTSSAESSINSLSNKTVTVTVVTRNVEANAKGTRNSVGGPALVDDGGGAELIEHKSRGTFELGTNDGPRITTLDKGDVVHTASETKKILSRLGAVGGFFKNGLNQAKSILTGKAFGLGTDRVSGAISGLNLTGKNDKKKKKSSKSSNSSTKKAGDSAKKTTKNVKDLQSWLEKLFDWAEVRLDRLQRQTNEWIRSAAEAVGYVAKNIQTNGAIQSVQQQISDTNKAYDLYMAQAQKVQEKVKLKDTTIEKIQNGTIDINSYSKKNQERIKAYQEWC